jgi:hypothetical protein
VGIAAVAALLLGGLLLRPRSTDGGVFLRAWERAADSGSYRFRGDVEQARRPVSGVLKAGSAPKIDRLHLEGEIDLGASSSQFEVWTGDGSVVTDDAALAVRVADGATTRRVRGGQWEPADDSTAMLAPDGNFLSYLRAAEDPTVIGTEVRGGRTVTRYRFAVDGPRFAEMVADHAAEARRERGGLAPGTRVMPDVQFRGMTGSGELWVDADGLPVRQVLQLRFPEQAGEQISADVSLDFHEFGFAPHATRFSAMVWPAARVVLLVALTAVACGLVFAGFRHRRRATRRVTVVLVAASLVTSSMVGAAGAAPATPAAGPAPAPAPATSIDRASLLRQAAAAPPSIDPNRSPLAVAAASAPAVTTAGDSGVDTDGDGLSDFIEDQLGTRPTSDDTDGDGLIDRIEVDGLPAGGVTWYTDPVTSDTNHDGIGDGLEWDLDADGVIDDLDGDGTPDVHDDDNDGDGIVDSRDLTPAAAGDVVYGADQPLRLRVDGMRTTGALPTSVDFQIRPTDPSHLTFALSPLDWPADDKGQVRDLDNSPDDLMLVPMLEIAIPAGTFSMLPQEQLSPYGIGLGDRGPDGSQTAYLPLRLVTDERTGERVAFSARMLYPSQAWGGAHSVRLVWLVQVDNDIPCDPADTPPVEGCSTSGFAYNVPQTVHRYYEGWTLTGLQVSEAHGATMAVLYEDPTVDVDLHDAGPSWLLTDVLGARFLTADPQGDYAIHPDNIDDLLDRDRNGGGPTSVYGQPNLFQVENASYPTFDRAVEATTSTVIPGLLTSRYAPRWTGADSLRPSVVTAYTNATRSLSIGERRDPGGYVSVDGAAISFDLEPNGRSVVPVNTIAGVKWTQYCGGSGIAPVWAGCTPEQVVDGLQDRNGEVLLGADDPSEIVPSLDEAAAAGQNNVMGLYALTLLQGVTALLAQDRGSGAVAVPTFGFEADGALTDRMVELYDQFGFYGSNSTGFSKFVANKFVFESIIKAGKFGDFTRAITDARSIKQLQFLVDDVATGAWTAGIVLVLATMAVLAYFYVQGNEDVRIAVTVLAAVVPAITSFAFPVYTLYTLVKRGLVDVVGGFAGLTGEMLGTSNVAAGIAVFIGLGITWGFFIASVAGSGIEAFSAAFNAALASAIASSVLIVALGVLAVTGVGLILVGLLTVIDGILTLICEFGTETDSARLRTDFNDGQCFTVTGTVSTIITAVLYDYDLMIDVNRDDLIEPGTPEYDLTDPDLGYSVGNSMQIRLPVTTNLKMADGTDNQFFIGYQWLWSRDNARSTTTEYTATASAPETLSPERGTMASSWNVGAEPDHYWLAHPMYAMSETRTVVAEPLSFTQAGLNRVFEPSFNVGLALPAVECWSIPNPIIFPFPVIPVCYVRTFADSSSNAFGTPTYDVFPAHLSGMVAVSDRPAGRQGLAWDASFPVLVDADGDGAAALAAGGLDPDDRTTDLDGDGLSDAFELQQRQDGVAMDPSLWDTDLDGLTDRQEFEIGSDPAVADTDNDGLADGVEVRHQQYVLTAGGPAWNGQFVGGWEIGVTGRWDLTVGVPTTRTVWVSSDPTRADGDTDGIADAAERQLAQAPDPADRLDETGRAFSPTGYNISPLSITVTSDDGDGYVAPGQAVAVQTTTMATRAVEPGVVRLSVPSSAGVSPAPSGLPFAPDVFAGSQTLTNDFVVGIPAGGSGAFPVDVEAFARLESSSALPVDWTIAEETAIDATRQYVNAAAATRRADSADAYVIADGSSTTAAAKGGGDIRAITVPGGTQRALDVDTEPVGPQRLDYRFLRGEETPRVACTADGTCLTVWDHYDNCSTLTIESLGVSAPDGGTYEDANRGIEPAVYLERADGGPLELLWFPLLNGGNDLGDGAQRGPNGNGFPSEVTFCGDAWLRIEEVDGNAVTRDNNSAYQWSSYPGGSDGVSLGNRYPIDADTPQFSANASFANGDYRETRSGIQECWNIDVFCQRVDLRLSVEPRPAWRIGAAVSTAGSVVRSQFQLPTATLTVAGETIQPEDRNPDVASDGTGFAVVSERYLRHALCGADCANLWHEHRELVLTRYDATGVRLGERVLENFDRFNIFAGTAARKAELTVEWADGDWWVVMVDPAYPNQVRRYRVAADLSAQWEDQLVTDAMAGVTPAMAYDPVSDRSLLVYQDTGGAVRAVLYAGSSAVAISSPVALLGAVGGCGAGSAPQVAANPLTGGWLATARCNGVAQVVSVDASLASPSVRTLPTLGAPGTVGNHDVACPAWQAMPVADLRFEELPGSTTFADSSARANDGTSTAGAAPAAGYTGAPGAGGSDYAVAFDGTDDVVSLANPAGAAVSLAFWYRNTVSRAGQPFALRGAGADPYAIEIDPVSGALTWNTRRATGTGLADGAWHFVTVARSAAGAMAVYVDGVAISTTAVSAATAPGQGLRIEGGAGVALVDHLRVYAVGLGAEAVSALFARSDQQVCVTVASVDAATSATTAKVPWARHQFVSPDPRGGQLSATASLPLRIDDDLPTSSTLLGSGFVRGSGSSFPYLIAGTARDGISGVARVEVSVNGGPWQLATGAEAWTFPVEVTNGSYAIRTRAVDAVGNVEQVGAPVTLTVDGVVPVVGLTPPPASPVKPTVDPSTGDRTAVLNGTVSDAGSGVAADGVEVQLLLPTDTVRETGWQKATVSGANWTIAYAFAAAAPDVSNTYEVRVRSTDRAGNATGDAAGQGTLRLDDAAPSIELSATLRAADKLVGTVGNGGLPVLTGTVHDDGGSGIAGVDVAFVPSVRAPGDTSGLTWYPATVAATGPTVADSTWTVTAPAGLEDLYNLSVRTRDGAGNEKVWNDEWNGVVDTNAPRLVLTVARGADVFGDGLTYAFDVRCTATDLFLSEEAFSCPGEALADPVRTFVDANGPVAALFPDLAQLQSLDLAYTGYESTSTPQIVLSACDLHGNCATTTGVVPAAKAAASTTGWFAAVSSPTPGQHVAIAAGTVPVQVSVRAATGSSLTSVAVKVDGVVAASVPVTAGSTKLRTLVAVPMTAGSHTVTVVVNGTTTSSPVTFFADASAPTVALSTTSIDSSGAWAPGSDVIRLTGTVGDDGEILRVRVKVDNAAWIDARVDAAPGASGTWRAAVPVRNPDGRALSVKVRAYDRAGRLTEISGSSTVDLAPPGVQRPDTVIDTGPPATGTATSATFTFRGTARTNAVAGFSCRLDGGAPESCSSPWTVTGLSSGAHTVEVTAIDSSGLDDLSPAVWGWTVSASGPQATLTTKPTNPSGSKTATFAFGGPAGSTFLCSLDDALPTTCTSPATYSGLTVGAHTFAVAARAGGITGTPVEYGWTVVDEAPVARDTVVTVVGDGSGEPFALVAVDAGPLTYKITRAPQRGFLTGTAPNLTYVPDSGYVGPDSFAFVADDGQNTSAEATVSVTVLKTAFSAYGDERVVIGDRVTITQGGVAVNKASPAKTGANALELSIGLSSTLSDPAGWVVADTVRIGTRTTVWNVASNQLTNAGTIRGSTVKPVTLPYGPVPALPFAGAAGTADVRVTAPVPVRLAPGRYKVLKVDTGATLTLTGGVYTFATWDVAKGATIRAEAPTEIRVIGQVDIGERSKVGVVAGVPGLDARDLVFHVSGKNSPTPRPSGRAGAFSVGPYSTIDAYVVAPNGSAELDKLVVASGNYLGRWVTVGSDTRIGR